jgi:pre-mRNA-splicing helicase BRR2
MSGKEEGPGYNDGAILSLLQKIDTQEETQDPTDRPKTAETRELEVDCLSAVHTAESQDIVRTEIMRDNRMKDFDKKKESLGSITSEQFGRLVIKDEKPKADLEEDGGIAVIFDEEEEGED